MNNNNNNNNQGLSAMLQGLHVSKPLKKDILERELEKLKTQKTSTGDEFVIHERPDKKTFAVVFGTYMGAPFVEINLKEGTVKEGGLLQMTKDKETVEAIVEKVKGQSGGKRKTRRSKKSHKRRKTTRKH